MTHVAWQVGHIAFSQYRLALWRIRGERPVDAALFSLDFKRLFGANSVPQADSTYPPAELRPVLDRVHEQVLQELAGLDEGELDQPCRTRTRLRRRNRRRSCGAPTRGCCTPGRSACCTASWVSADVVRG